MLKFQFILYRGAQAIFLSVLRVQGGSRYATMIPREVTKTVMEPRVATSTVIESQEVIETVHEDGEVCSAPKLLKVCT